MTTTEDIKVSPISKRVSPMLLRAKNTMQAFTNIRQITILFLGFSSGLPLALSSGTLQAWYTDAGIDLFTIGLLSFVGLPYLFKPLWSPLMDRYVPPFLGRRRGWMIVTQVLLITMLIKMSFLSPQQMPFLLAVIAMIVAFGSASQDIVINAYTAEILHPNERGLGAAMTSGGYRVAMLVSSGVALILADHIGWHATYLMMAACMGIGVVAAFFAPEPALTVEPPKSILAAIFEPLKEFLTRRSAWMILLMIILYKLGDAFAISLSTTFLLRGLGFTLTDVGIINKLMTQIGGFTGIFLGGFWMLRMSLYRSLMIFGLFQALSNLIFTLLALVGKHFYFAAFAIFFENFCGGMATAAFLAFIMMLCDKRYTATQFALLSALSAVGRVIVGPFAAVMVAAMGWAEFYFMTVLISLPGLFLLWGLRKHKMFSTS